MLRKFSQSFIMSINYVEMVQFVRLWRQYFDDFLCFKKMSTFQNLMSTLVCRLKFEQHCYSL